MVRKFECWDCHKVFEADDKKDVLCPNCKSDNVDYVSRHIPYTKIALGIIAIAIVGYGIDFMLNEWQRFNINRHDNNPTIDTPDTSIIVSEEKIDSTFEEETGLKIPPSISLDGEKKLNDNETYSFKVKVDHAPNVSYVITLTEKTSGAIVAKSEDGSFTDVPPSKAEGGIYLIQIVDKKADTLLSTPQPMDGFFPIVKVNHKLSVEDLQKLIDSEDESLIGNGENPYIAPVYTIKYKGLSNEDSHPDNLADVLEKLYGVCVWSRAKVESLEYDENNHISCITLKITK